MFVWFKEIRLRASIERTRCEKGGDSGDDNLEIDGLYNQPLSPKLEESASVSTKLKSIVYSNI